MPRRPRTKAAADSDAGWVTSATQPREERDLLVSMVRPIPAWRRVESLAEASVGIEAGEADQAESPGGSIEASGAAEGG